MSWLSRGSARRRVLTVLEPSLRERAAVRALALGIPLVLALVLTLIGLLIGATP